MPGCVLATGGVKRNKANPRAQGMYSLDRPTVRNTPSAALLRLSLLLWQCVFTRSAGVAMVLTAIFINTASFSSGQVSRNETQRWFFEKLRHKKPGTDLPTYVRNIF